MTDKPTTLRERVFDIVRDYDPESAWGGLETAQSVISSICDALEDTGSPAHMRVAKELRGEE